MPTKKLKKGDTVSWKSSQGTVTGTVVKKTTRALSIKSHTVAASKENPEYIVRSKKTGATAAHTPGALKKT